MLKFDMFLMIPCEGLYLAQGFTSRSVESCPEISDTVVIKGKKCGSNLIVLQPVYMSRRETRDGNRLHHYQRDT